MSDTDVIKLIYTLQKRKQFRANFKEDRKRMEIRRSLNKLANMIGATVLENMQKWNIRKCKEEVPYFCTKNMIFQPQVSSSVSMYCRGKRIDPNKRD